MNIQTVLRLSGHVTKKLCIFITMICVPLSFVSAADSLETPQTVSSLLAGLAARQEGFKSLTCKWEQQVSTQPIGGRNDDSKSYDNEDSDRTTYSQQWSLSLEGQKLRTDCTGLQWDVIGGAFEEWPSTFIFDGTRNIWYEGFMSEKSVLPDTYSGPWCDCVVFFQPTK